MIPGEGDFNWMELRSALMDVGYDRYLTVELYTHTEHPQDAADKSFQFLSKHFG